MQYVAKLCKLQLVYYAKGCCLVPIHRRRIFVFFLTTISPSLSQAAPATLAAAGLVLPAYGSDG
jgi:hypothetical protein